MCKCKSYNLDLLPSELMIDEEVIIRLPEAMCEEVGKETVCVDSCIVGTMKAIWSENIVTLGCCCGHNRDRPWIIIPSGSKDATKIKQIIDVVNDKRDWKILSWELIEQ